MSDQIRVDSADETASALKKYGELIANDVDPARQVAQLGASGARANAPVVTGELAAGYAVQDRFVVNPVDYSLYVEYGTQYMEAQYPIRNSLEVLESQAEQIYGDWSQKMASEAGFEPSG